LVSFLFGVFFIVFYSLTANMVRDISQGISLLVVHITQKKR